MGEIEEVNRVFIPYKPRPPQLELHNAVDEYRFVVGVAHRRMGKTVAALNQLIKSALENDKEAPRYGYIAPTYGQAKRVAFDYLCKYTRPLNAVINVAELRVDFLGRRIQLYGSDNPDSLRGQYWDMVCIDEVGDQNPKIWNEIVRPALSDRKGKCLFIGTPKGNNHFKELRDRAENEPGWKLLEFKASQTNLIDEAELKDARKEMGDDKFNQEFECDFSASVEGSYYGKLINDLEDKGRMVEIDRDDLCKTYCAWDLGIGDSTVIFVLQVTGLEYRIMDHVENHGQGLDWYVNWLKDNNWHKAEQLLPHDVEVRELGTGKSRLEVLREAGLDVRVLPRLAVEDGIQAVRRMLPKCWFNMPKVKQGLDCLRNYRREYDEKRSVFYDKPLHDWASHSSDSFRYLALGLEQTTSWSQPIKINTKWIV